MKDRVCVKCEHVFELEDRHITAEVSEKGVHVIINCPECDEESEFAIVEEKDFIKM